MYVTCRPPLRAGHVTPVGHDSTADIHARDTWHNPRQLRPRWTRPSSRWYLASQRDSLRNEVAIQLSTGGRVSYITASLQNGSAVTWMLCLAWCAGQCTPAARCLVSVTELGVCSRNPDVLLILSLAGVALFQLLNIFEHVNFRYGMRKPGHHPKGGYGYRASRVSWNTSDGTIRALGKTLQPHTYWWSVLNSATTSFRLRRT